MIEEHTLEDGTKIPYFVGYDEAEFKLRRMQERKGCFRLIIAFLICSMFWLWIGYLIWG